MPYLDTANTRLFYLDQGEGPAVLFSHGFLMDHEMYADQVRQLSRRYRCVSWDQRGFGKSAEAKGPFSYWDSARDALDLLDHLEIREAVFVGLSQGGFLSMRAALLAPERVRGLVLISTKSGLDSEETQAGFGQLRGEWGLNGSANVASGLTALLIGEGTNPAPWHTKWKGMSRTALEWPIGALTGRDDLTPRLGEIRAPALVIHGDADIAIDSAEGTALSQSLPRSHGLHIVPGGGHAVPLTQSEEVTRSIETFLLALA